MKFIAYALLAAASFALGCWAPAFADRAAMTALGFACALALFFRDERRP